MIDYENSHIILNSFLKIRYKTLDIISQDGLKLKKK